MFVKKFFQKGLKLLFPIHKLVIAMPLTDQLSEKELSRIFNLLKHPLRREILRQLSKNSQTYSQLLRKLNVKESSFLNYHLRKMDGLLIEKMTMGNIN